MTPARLLAAALILMGTAELGAQVVIGRDPPRERPPARRHLYDRPVVSPWVGADGGLGGSWARCQDCGVEPGGPVIFGSLAGGITVHSRVAIGVEHSRLVGALLDDEVKARLTMLTGRFGTRLGLLGKIGIGTARFTRFTTRLVDDEVALMVGGEKCELSRADGCLFADYSHAAGGAYRMHTARAGFALRFHILRGRRVTLSPRGE